MERIIMSIIAVKKQSVSDQVFEQIKQQIISGKWAPGEKIPSELELAKMFDVSRVSVREAIHRLIGMGVLYVRRGEGTYVSEMLPEDYFNALLPILMVERSNLIEMLEFRSILEVESIKLACSRANEDDISRLQKTIANMKKNRGDNRKFAAEDLNFHLALAIATHNAVIVKVNAIIHDMLKAAMEKVVELTGFDKGIYYHEKILDALINRDENAATELMREHIEVTMEKIRQHQEIEL
ncbi:MAG: FadR family transcriptional regulator [Clostridiales bacterium]|nr:FadR family transcriptional regulator [Clostridiales bacterium]